VLRTWGRLANGDNLTPPQSFLRDKIDTGQLSTWIHIHFRHRRTYDRHATHETRGNGANLIRLDDGRLMSTTNVTAPLTPKVSFLADTG